MASSGFKCKSWPASHDLHNLELCQVTPLATFAYKQAASGEMGPPGAKIKVSSET